MRIGQVATSDSRVEEITKSVVVTRCGCGNPDVHNGVSGPAGVCPKPLRIEDHGIVADYYRKPWKRFVVWITRNFREGWNSGKVRGG